jgi:hypothetical protein
MGDWDRNADWNRDVLERIVALLFALANLADLAAGAPFLRRRQVLEILSHGEAEARAFVMGVAFGAPATDDATDVADDAVHLAASFRALALAKQSALPAEAGPRAGRRRPAGRVGRPTALPLPDT